MRSSRRWPSGLLHVRIAVARGMNPASRPRAGTSAAVSARPFDPSKPLTAEELSETRADEARAPVTADS